MYYFKAFSSILACVAVVKAQTKGFNPFLTPTAGQKIKAGQDFEILWQPSGASVDATVTIKLLQGDNPKALQVASIIAPKISSKAGRYMWHVPTSIEDHEVYGLAMYLDNKNEVYQFSFPFDIDCLDNNKDHPATPPVPKKSPSHTPDTGKYPGPNKPHDHDHDDDDHDDDDDDKHDKDDDKDDNDDYDDHDDDDDDDDHHHAPIPSGVPYPNPKTNNGTYPHGAPKPSAAHPPAAKPSSYDPPAQQPKPKYTGGAKTIAINSFALVCGIAISLAL